MPLRLSQPIKVAIATLAFATTAQAHPRLVSAVPAANGTIASTNELRLTFSEMLVPQFSGMSILMTAKPGMKLAAPRAGGTVASTVAADGKTLLGTLKTPLAAGTYTLGWHVVSTDTHRLKGSYSFTVK
jgi:methionine-rich copper-binding protein CopC